MGAKRRYAQPKAVTPRRGSQPKLKIVNPIYDPEVERHLSRQTVKASLLLREARGEVFQYPKSKDQPHRVLDELDVMLMRGEINEPQYRAGRNYGDRFREGFVKGVYRSSIALNNRSNTGDKYDVFFHKRMSVFIKLHRDRKVGLKGDPRRIALCDAILGREQRLPPGGQRAQLVEEIGSALTQLSYYFGYQWR